MTHERKEQLFKKMFCKIIEITPCIDEAYDVLKRCGFTEQEIKELEEYRSIPITDETVDFYQSVESYAAGYMTVVSEPEYVEYRQYLDYLKEEVFIDRQRTAEFIVEEERKARIRDYNRRMTGNVTSDIYSTAVEHIKNALFDSKPFMKE